MWSACGSRHSNDASFGRRDPNSRPDTCNRDNDQRSFAWDYAAIPVLRELRASSALSSALAKEAITSDVIHNHGLWLMPNVYAGWAASRARTPLIVAPRGMLGHAALSFSRMKKVLFWHLLQGPAIRCAACYHATSRQEYEDIRAYGLKHPVAIIPNGIDLPQLHSNPASTDAADRVVLSLGRIHPKKGLDRLVRAWAKVEAAHPGWRLRIVGPAELGHDAQLRALAATLKLSRVSIEPAIYGEEKYAAFREADLFVLPTLNENFAMTVAESLAAGTPVISTKGAPWAGLEVERCGWWIDHGIEPLAAALSGAMALPRAELRAMGARGQAWMARDFGWDAIASKMAAVYTWLAGKAAAPNGCRSRDPRNDRSARHRCQSTCRQMDASGAVPSIPLGAGTAGLASHPTSILGPTALVAAAVRRPGWSRGTYHRTVRIAIPWNLSIEDEAAIGDCVQIYNLGQVSIGAQATISQGAHLCAGTHDHRRPDLPLVKCTITIGRGAWICADAFVGPNVSVGDFAILGARAVVVRDVAPGVVVAGNPARIVGRRECFNKAAS